MLQTDEMGLYPDPVKEFVAQKLKKNPLGNGIGAANLYDNYATWAEDKVLITAT